MKKILFVSSWAKDKKKTWSGTTWGVFDSLRHYSQVIDCNVTMSKVDKIFNMLLGFVRKHSWTQQTILLYRRIFVRRYITENISNEAAVFQFAEIVQEEPSLRTYIYLDNSVSYLLYVKYNLHHLFPFLGVERLSDKEMEERHMSQMEYFQKCSGIFTMGRWLENDLVKRCGIPKEKVHCVGGGINIDIQTITPKNKTRNKILFVGRDFKRKGGYVTYDAFVKVKDVMHEVELYVAGPSIDPIPDHIEGYHFMGDCDKTKLMDLYNECDIFCMPSYFEAYGLVFIEALSCGLPCIGRNCYEMPYFIEEGVTGELICDDDAAALASKIEKILNDENYFMNVQKRQEWYLKEYSWDNVARKIVNTINFN